jgi:2-keto-4-pentenoate hydratase/2-oxohepta-3-ene-1,7-dioic acid hydratase in catechol pathway
MKLASFERPDGSASWGVVKDGGIVDLGAEAPSLRAALSNGVAFADAAGRRADHAVDAVSLLPPIPDPDKILCLGLNYASHIRETGREPPTKPVIFVRFANSQVGHGHAMIRPNASDNFDFEGEMALVVGKRCRHVKRKDAAAVVAGYSCYNDGSIRDWQRHSIQFTPGKNFPATGGFGPWLVTPDETGDIASATLITRLNGEEVQRATISDLVFDVPAIIEYCSTFTELVPGDVIVTGTTGGVGAARNPPLWMKPGDVVEVEIDRIGILRNTIEQES